MNFEELEKKVMDWADAKGITENSDPMIQASKTLEELGELIHGLATDDAHEVHDSFGDILVTLIIGYGMINYKGSIVDALQSAYDVISKRTGKMVNGKFIRDN
jgi:NTP pyrophosphatase (non-canonical NTP hydrolase)